MTKLEEIVSLMSELKLEELSQLKNEINNKINDKKEVKNVIYKHDCFGSSKYHFGKYKHFAKVLTAIDDSKINGYAFIGDFVSVEKENLVREGSYVVEVCWEKIVLYKIISDGKELLLEGNYSELVSFIRKAKEITTL